MNKILLLTLMLLPLKLMASFQLNRKAEPDSSQAQKGSREKKFDVTEWKRIFNRSFGSILGSAGSNNDIGNYASFDPIDGAFKFKGIVPIGKEEKSISYLSLSVQGGIASNDFNKLFDGFKIGTNSGIQAEYHFKRTVKATSITREAESEVIYNRQRDLVNLQAELDKTIIMQDSTKSTERITILDNTLLSIISETPKVLRKLDSTLTYLNKINNDIINTREPPSDSLLKLLRVTVKSSREFANMKDSLLKMYKKIYRESDSLKINVEKWRYVSRALKNAIHDKRDVLLDTLKNSYKFSRFKIDWITIIGSLGKKKYHDFDSTLPFDEQIKENNFYTNSFGLAWSLYIKNETEKRSSLFNIGLVRKRDNNTDTLSTTDVNQAKTLKNEKGDVVNTVSKKYSAYTDPILSNQLINAYFNYFYIFGKRQSALHIFPSYIKPDRKAGYLNIGIGYIISFKNTKKDNPIINAELYALSSDSFNGQGTNRSFLKRIDIGLKFSLPFNLF